MKQAFLKNRPGFTLVELLVVVGIMALLLAILVPSLQQARQQAQAMVCLTNMRNMGVALQMYLPENQYRLPPSSCKERNPDKYWLYLLNRYSSKPLLFRCPSDRSGNFMDWADPPADDWLKYRWASYASNGFFDNRKYSGFCKPDSLKNPDMCIYLCEIPSTEMFNGVDHVHADAWESNEDVQGSIAWQRHNDKSNYLFVDGHSAVLGWQETWDYPGVNLWNPATAPGWPPPDDDMP